MTRYLKENQDKRSIADDALHLLHLDKFIGDLDLESLHIGTLQPYIEARRRDEVKAKTIKQGLGVVRHILNVAASEWVDEHGLTWLAAAPKIKLLKTSDGRTQALSAFARRAAAALRGATGAPSQNGAL